MKKEEFFIEEYIRLVKSIANRYRNMGIPIEDLVQEGLLGVFEANDKFKNDKGTKFTTYATYWIKKKIIDALNKKNQLSISSLPYNDELRQMPHQEESINMKKGIDFPESVPPMEKDVLKMYFEQGKTLKEIAENLNIRREQARQIKEKGLRRIKILKNSLTEI
jgi:RNA polymerase sigma factor (sigma-70 family)